MISAPQTPKFFYVTVKVKRTVTFVRVAMFHAPMINRNFAETITGRCESCLKNKLRVRNRFTLKSITFSIVIP